MKRYLYIKWCASVWVVCVHSCVRVLNVLCWSVEKYDKTIVGLKAVEFLFFKKKYQL